MILRVGVSGLLKSVYPWNKSGTSLLWERLQVPGKDIKTNVIVLSIRVVRL